LENRKIEKELADIAQGHLAKRKLPFDHGEVLQHTSLITSPQNDDNFVHTILIPEKISIPCTVSIAEYFDTFATHNERSSMKCWDENDKVSLEMKQGNCLFCQGKFFPVKV